ncbi:MAG: pyridoxine 5'-phosphate synthase [Elusimicrobia bacterium]|nr:pyridoxine 5'-phosphate synthase [Elusimicrobiota bacterium]
MATAKLGVCLDYFAQLREAGGEDTPELSDVANELSKAGVHVLLAHLRPEKKPLTEKDIADLKRQTKLSLQLHLAPDPGLVPAAARLSPAVVVFSPEKSGEETRGFEIQKNEVQKEVGKAIESVKKKGVKVGLLLESNAVDIRLGKRLGADLIELNARTYIKASSKARRQSALEDLHIAGRLVRELELGLHVGHGLDCDHVAEVAQVYEVQQINVGFALVARSLFVGLPTAVEDILEAIRTGSENPLTLEA